jgi:hypothetical protein
VAEKLSKADTLTNGAFDAGVASREKPHACTVVGLCAGQEVSAQELLTYFKAAQNSATVLGRAGSRPGARRRRSGTGAGGLMASGFAGIQLSKLTVLELG